MKSLLALLFCVVTVLSPTSLFAQQPPVGTISPSVEKKLKELPPGPLFWRIENFPTLAQAQAAAGPTGIGYRVCRQGLAIHSGSKGRVHDGGN